MGVYACRACRTSGFFSFRGCSDFPGFLPGFAEIFGGLDEAETVHALAGTHHPPPTTHTPRHLRVDLRAVALVAWWNLAVLLMLYRMAVWGRHLDTAVGGRCRSNGTCTCSWSSPPASDLRLPGGLHEGAARGLPLRYRGPLCRWHCTCPAGIRALTRLHN